jgi:hypothetical protein
MDNLDFTLELNSDYLPKETEYALFTQAEGRLKELAAGHDDLTGAAINIRQPAAGVTPPLHEVTVVVYARPKNIAATEKAAEPQPAMKGALDAVVEQVREKRDKLQKRWKQPGNLPAEQEVTELMAAEEADDLPASDLDSHFDEQED